MKVGIDVSRYGHSEATGVEWYSYHLLNEMMPLLGRDHQYEFQLYSPTAVKFDVDLPFNVSTRVIPFFRIWTLLRLSWEMITHPVDILFIPSHILPFFCPKKTIITIHDVAFVHIPEVYSKKQLYYLKWNAKRSVKKASKIIVPSEATKRDLIEHFGADASKISVVYHGGPQIEKFPATPIAAETDQHFEKFQLKLRDLFILFVGRLETKKNLPRLLEAFKRFLVEFPDWKIILAGKPGVGYETIVKKIEELGLQKNVLLPGYITEKEKIFLLEHCRIFAFPSLYEGFGLPVLEAFKYGKPVLTSKTSSMPEVAGNAAFLVNPEKVEELSVGLKRLAQDGMMVSKYIQQGEQQLKKFTWDKAAEETVKIILG